MRSPEKLWLCALLLLASVARATDTGKLLPTAPLAKQVIALGKLLSDSPPGTTMDSRRKAGLAVRDRISQFIVDQIKAKPDITQPQLRAQLQAILCSAPYNDCGCDQPPYVFANVWFGPMGASQFVVAYRLGTGFVGGVISVIESYIVDDGKTVRRVARGGSELDGYVPNFQMVRQFFNPAEIWVLTWGMVEGASGRGLHARATVYRVGSEEVKIAWDDEKEDNLTAQSNDIGWEVSYANHDLLYGNDPKPYFFDVYKIRSGDRTFNRVVHLQHGED